MYRNMVTSLIYHERIMTTTPRAKELRKIADKLITQAKDGSLHKRRLAAAVVREKAAVVKLFEILGPRYMSRPGGYTRVLKLARPRKEIQPKWPTLNLWIEIMNCGRLSLYRRQRTCEGGH